MGGKRAERLQVMLTQDEVLAVDDWRFENRLPSRSAAARALMHIGLKAPPPVADESSDAFVGHESGDFGVVDVDPDVAKRLNPNDAPHVLVVDGQSLEAHGVVNLLRENGFSVTGPVSDISEATATVTGSTIAAAVIEKELGGTSTDKLASVLKRENIPFVYCTDHEMDHDNTQPVISRASAVTALGEAIKTLID